MMYDQYKREEERDNLLHSFLTCLLNNQKQIKGDSVIRSFWHTMIEEYVEYRIAERMENKK